MHMFVYIVLLPIVIPCLLYQTISIYGYRTTLLTVLIYILLPTVWGWHIPEIVMHGCRRCAAALIRQAVGDHFLVSETIERPQTG